MTPITYVPVLKAKPAEIAALNSRRAPGVILPLFEFQAVLAPSKNKEGKWQNRKTASATALDFLDTIALEWPHRMLLDVSRAAAPAMRAAWWSMLTSHEAVRPTQTRATIVPVVRLADPVGALTAAAHLASKADAAAIRIDMPTNAATLRTGVTTVAGQLGLPVEKVMLVLDWKDGLEPDDIPLDDAVRQTVEAIDALPEAHGEVVTVGTPVVAAARQEGYWVFERREWLLWARARARHTGLLFGDYALFEPGDPVRATPKYGYLRYSADSSLHIWREAPPATGGGLGGAFAVCCQKAVVDSAFAGAGFSPGDDTIANVAGGAKAPGRAQDWREVSLSHHFALVRQQLAAPPSAASTGSH